MRDLPNHPEKLLHDFVLLPTTLRDDGGTPKVKRVPVQTLRPPGWAVDTRTRTSTASESSVSVGSVKAPS